jgi:hypothetical protein
LRLVQFAQSDVLRDRAAHVFGIGRFGLVARLAQPLHQVTGLPRRV